MNEAQFLDATAIKRVCNDKPIDYLVKWIHSQQELDEIRFFLWFARISFYAVLCTLLHIRSFLFSIFSRYFIRSLDAVMLLLLLPRLLLLFCMMNANSYKKQQV